MPGFYEFFAGGGMARAGLGSDWKCLRANDFDPKKGSAYRANWLGDDLIVADVGGLTIADLPGTADLAWASFPCQDLSLAGSGAGLKGGRSGTFWPFWRLMQQLAADQRAPKIIVLENVCGALHSHGGRDFCAISHALAAGGYRFGGIVIDAVHFVPQSRPRLFIIAIREDLFAESGKMVGQSEVWHPDMLRNAHARLDARTAEKWVWWKLPSAPLRNTTFADVIEDAPASVRWHTREETARILRMMSDVNRDKVRAVRKSGVRTVGGVYKRTRLDDEGNKVQRAEVRFDDISGCLRTPVGGSSRQTILIVHGERIRSRLLSTREAARLMGLPETYVLPENYNEAYHLAGDGVVVPVVRFLAQHVIEPLLKPPVVEKHKKAA